MERVIYTIGHSTHSTERFQALLADHGVTAVADVRSQPYSRVNPQFNREELKADLERAGIDYVFLGRELGARSDDPAHYLNGQVQYSRLARSVLFQDGIDRVVKSIGIHRVALLCAEKDPLVCHRTILVCRELVSRGVEPRHILEDGRIETQEESDARLLREMGMPEVDLFRSRGELVAEAYDRRGRDIAYESKGTPAGEPLRRASR